ncbi:MAG: hypothetical protein LC799_17160 [Actinobacteria bacterium]|nr:hypothetical protein [Actinomycetota bacterium]
MTMHHALGLGWIGARHRRTAVLDKALARSPQIRPQWTPDRRKPPG